MEDARQAGGGQCDKREEGERETSGWRAIQGDRAANNTTRGGGQRTLCKAMGRWTTQREARVDDAGRSDKTGVDDAGRSDGGQLKERRGVEDPTRRRTTRQAEGSRGPNAGADDTTIDNGKAAVAKMAFNFAVACITLATFTDPCSVVHWLLHRAPLLLLFASVRHSLLPRYLCHSPRCCWLVVVLRAATHPLHFCCPLLHPCNLC